MEKIKITKEMLEGNEQKILGKGKITDEEIKYYGWGSNKKSLKFVVCKGYGENWCIYLENMKRNMDYEDVKRIGNKIHSRANIKLLVDCDDEVLERYRN